MRTATKDRKYKKVPSRNHRAEDTIIKLKNILGSSTAGEMKQKDTLVTWKTAVELTQTQQQKEKNIYIYF